MERSEHRGDAVIGERQSSGFRISLICGLWLVAGPPNSFQPKAMGECPLIAHAQSHAYAVSTFLFATTGNSCLE
jgi:hypothetical protein